jgi:nitrite reductase (NO-forming)
MSFPAHIVLGTCESADFAAAPAFPLADATYSLPSSGGPATPEAAPRGGETTGGEAALPVAASVTMLSSSPSALTEQPHAVAVMAGSAGTAQDVVACGAIGGTHAGADLLFGLHEVNDSGYAGVGWITPTDSGVTVTVFLTALTAPVAATAGEGVAAPDLAGTPAPTAAATPAAQAAPTTVTIEAVDIDFIPAEVTIPADTDVTIDLPNHGVILHNFSITDHKNPNVPNLGISVNIDPGATEHVTVNAPAGDYYYYCNIPGHEAAGMYGTMHVVAP